MKALDSSRSHSSRNAGSRQVRVGRRLIIAQQMQDGILVAQIGERRGQSRFGIPHLRPRRIEQMVGQADRLPAPIRAPRRRRSHTRRARFPSLKIMLNGLYCGPARAADRACRLPCPATRAPRSPAGRGSARRHGARAAPSLKLVKAAKRPSRPTPSQVPPAFRSRPARMPRGSGPPIGARARAVMKLIAVGREHAGKFRANTPEQQDQAHGLSTPRRSYHRLISSTAWLPCSEISTRAITSMPAFSRRNGNPFSAGHWQMLGPVSRVAKPGDYLAVDVAGWKLFALRGRDGLLRAFHNVCRHRGARLLPDGQGKDAAVALPLSSMGIRPGRSLA